MEQKKAPLDLGLKMLENYKIVRHNEFRFISSEFGFVNSFIKMEPSLFAFGQPPIFHASIRLHSPLSHLKNAHKSAFLLYYRLYFHLPVRPLRVILLPFHNIPAPKPPNRYNYFCLKTQQKSKLQFWAD